MQKDTSNIITTQDVEHIAHLSRIEISEEDKIRFTDELGNIITYINKLKEVDTTGIDPTFRIAPLSNVFREDIPKDSFPAEDILLNAPDRENGYFRMPKIIGE